MEPVKLPAPPASEPAPAPTWAEQAAEETRQACNNLTTEQRQALLERAKVIIGTDPKGQAGAAKPPLGRQEGGSHYATLAMQPVEFITANKLTFLEGCVIKRLCRHKAKGGAEDIRKAIHELELILALEYA